MEQAGAETGNHQQRLLEKRLDLLYHLIHRALPCYPVSFNVEMGDGEEGRRRKVAEREERRALFY